MGILPGPVFLSAGDSVGGGQITKCAANILECQHRISEFELLQHQFFGYRVGYRNSQVLSIQLQPNKLFSNGGSLIPLTWRKDYFYLGQVRLLRIFQYEKQMTVIWTDWVVTGLCFYTAVNLCMFLQAWWRIYKVNDVDISGSFSD